MKRLTFLAICSIAISGCAVIQQQQQQKAMAEQQQSFNREYATVTEKCKSQLEGDKRIDPIRPYVPMLANDATLEQRGSTKKPTAKEKSAILAFDEIASECRNELSQVKARFGSPAQVQNTSKKYGDLQRELRAQLWAGKITYGEFATKRIQISNEGKVAEQQALAEYQQQARQVQMQQAQINAVNAQANAALISAQAQQQIANNDTMRAFTQAQQRNLPPQPVQTNCYKTGNQVNCTTY